EKEFVNRLLKMMKNKDNKAAFVFTMDAFDTFGEYYQEFQKLANDNYKYGNLILLKAPIEVEGSLHMLSEPYSIYRTSLFSDIQGIFDEYENARVYELMKKKMPNRVSYMNELRLEELEHLVRYTILSEDVKVNTRLPFAEDYAACIYYLYHSRKFRDWVKGHYSYVDQQFPQNPKRTFYEIEAAMKKDTTYRILDGILLKIRELANHSTRKMQRVIPEVLDVCDCGDEHQEFLYMKSSIWDQIAILSYEFIENEEIKAEIKTKIAKIRKDLLTACVNRDEDAYRQQNEYISVYINKATSAQGQRDTKSFQYAVDALYYAICECAEQVLVQGTDTNKEEQLENEKARLDCYRYILDYQSDIFSYRKTIEENRKIQKKNVDKWKRYYASIKDMEKQVPDISNKALEYIELGKEMSGIPDEWSDFCMEYLKQKKVATDLAKDIAHRRTITDMMEEKLMHAQKMVNELDISLSSLKLSHGKNLRKEMSIILENISIAFDRVREEFTKNSKIKNLDFESVPMSYAENIKKEYAQELPKKFEIDEELLENIDLLNEIE
ncbi:MAG: hypothetical protein U0L12_07490, partial [Ruminococcus sp.]|nr:hypothetical protein [Ruminococcus sp.]